MGVAAVKLRIDSPIGDVIPGRGFYQLEEETLLVPLARYAEENRFFSYLEAEHVRLEFDRTGLLLIIEIDLPRRRWKIDSEFRLPPPALPADIRWLDFRDTIPAPEITADPERRCLRLMFSEEKPAGTYALADNVILQSDREHNLVAVWVTEIVDDFAGREIARFHNEIMRPQRG